MTGESRRDRETLMVRRRACAVSNREATMGPRREATIRAFILRDAAKMPLLGMRV
jgi:hypothetical protein